MKAPSIRIVRSRLFRYNTGRYNVEANIPIMFLLSYSSNVLIMLERGWLVW